MRRQIGVLISILALATGCAQSRRLAPTPPMGWNSWNTFQVRIDEKLIKETAAAMVANGMRDAGYVYVNLDDGWSEMSRDANGNLVGDHARFPSGMKSLGDYLHKRGFKFGIYNCCGTKTCAGFPGGKDHEIQDAKTYASWGVDYLKYDWCNTQGMDGPATYRKMSDALRATGRPIVFSICEWGTSKPWLWAPQVAQLWRTTGDIEANYPSWKKILDAQVGLEKFSGVGHWNDPDMLEVGNGKMTLAESRGHFSMWCMLAAPLIAGNDVREMNNDVRAILTNREVIAIDQDALGRQGFRAAVSDGFEIWAKELAGNQWAICALNTRDSTAKLELNWQELTFLDRNYSVRDLWTCQDLNDTRMNFTGDVRPHDVAFFCLRPKSH